jgi:glycolate oxidase
VQVNIHAVIMDESLYAEFKECGCELLEKLLPRIVLLVNSEESVSKLIALAARRRLRLCPTGTGTSFPANYESPPNQVFLLTLGLNQLAEVRHLDSIIVAGAGIVVRELSVRLEATELKLPQILADYRGTLGGAVLGPDITGLRQSEIRRRLLGVELVDPRGRLLKFGGATIKNVAGYDFWTFLVGTRGRFGVLTKLILNLDKMSPASPGAPVASHPSAEEAPTRWIYANLEKKLDPDGIFAR